VNGAGTLGLGGPGISAGAFNPPPPAGTPITDVAAWIWQGNPAPPRELGMSFRYDF
jgi:hypothetical protein